jgi:hypothetical protein
VKPQQATWPNTEEEEEEEEEVLKIHINDNIK